MQSSTLLPRAGTPARVHHSLPTRHPGPFISTLRLIPLILALSFGAIESGAQGRTITAFPYSQSFAFIPSGTSTTPNGPIGTAIFPTTDVDGGEFIVDSNTNSLMVNGSTTGLNNGVGAGGVIRIQTSGSALPTIAQGFIVHAGFASRIAGTISIDWTKVANGTSTRSNELRIAASADGGAFTDIASVTFDNSATAQFGTLTTTLPTTLDGVTSVRFRIYSINVSGSGGHPRVVVDNLGITAEAETPLPVELADFVASYHDGTVGLDWRTASEHENEGFEIHRALASDSLFAPVASFRTHEQLRGLGTSPIGREYHFDDELPPSLMVDATTILYRLVDVAPDGSRRDHPLRSVRIDRDRSASAATALVRMRLDPPRPSPADTRAVARVSLATTETISMEIIRTTGERVWTSVGSTLAAGSHEREIPVAGIESGRYLLIARSGDAIRVQPLVIAR